MLEAFRQRGMSLLLEQEKQRRFKLLLKDFRQRGDGADFGGG